MDNITDYYGHNIPMNGKKVKLSNNITNTFIVLSRIEIVFFIRSL